MRGRRVTVHSAPWVLPIAGPPVAEGAVAARAGVVLAVGPRARVLAEAGEAGGIEEEIRWSGVILPGLVNAHTHLQYSHMADVGSRSYPGFEEWSHAFQEVYESAGHDWHAAATDGARQALATGTTAIAEVVTDVQALPVLAEQGLRGVTYWELMSWLEDRWLREGRARTAAVLGTVPRGRNEVGLSPHAPYSLDTAVVADLTRFARQRGVRRHVHLAESAWEEEYVREGRGRLADQWRRWGFGEFRLLREGGSGLRPVPYLGDLGALGPDCHIAHGVYVDAHDRAVLRATGTAVALCPRSNAVIGLDEAPVAAYLREGNRIAVGTDSLSSCPSLDLLADVGALASLARRQGYRDADLAERLLHAATLGGAAALGLDRPRGGPPAGALAPGAAADLAIVDVAGRRAVDVQWAVAEHGEGRVVGTLLAGELQDVVSPTGGSTAR